VREKKPVLVFLMETKIMQNKSSFLKVKLGFDSVFTVDCKGRSGGLILLWKKEIEVEIQNYSRRHINAVIQCSNEDPKWKFTRFYGHPDANRRREAWSLLRCLPKFSPEPWLCIGDFNAITSCVEKYSSSFRPSSHNFDFQQALADCHLVDLGFHGPKYTWTNGRCGSESSDLTRERLDRAVANAEWSNLFNVTEVFVLACTVSDHNPILLTCSNSQEIKWTNYRYFRYEAGWAKQKEHGDLIKRAWQTGPSQGDRWKTVRGSMERCKKTLKQWVRKTENQLEAKIMEVSQKLLDVQTTDPDFNSVVETTLQSELHSLLEQEEIKWKQRAREDWLKYGDQNTKLFNASANQKSRRKLISKIVDKDSRTCTTQCEIENAFKVYFQDLFSARSNLEVEQSLAALERKVTSQMNERLVADLSMEEISQALKQMAPGPDGFPAVFFQQNWPTTQEEVCSAIFHFFNTWLLDASINRTYIALIPKKASLVNVSDFRPISLCNVIYKLISKVLANRLKTILPHIISPTQSAFIPGRLISDNVLAAYEAMHSMQTRMWGKTGFMGFKLDLSKAYDRVEWSFLKAAMLRLGFDVKWVQLVMTCVTSVQYAVLINGTPANLFQPSRGIRQGDPISPYLFLICAEVFSSLLSQAEKNGIISGVPTSPRGPKISHLFFADDCIIFCKSNSVEWRRVLRILGTFEAGSGQKVNLMKTSFFFFQ